MAKLQLLSFLGYSFKILVLARALPPGQWSLGLSKDVMLLFGVIVITPLWLEETMGYTSLIAGLTISTMGIIPFCSTFVVAKLIERVQIRYIVMFSFLSFAACLFFFATFTTAH